MQKSAHTANPVRKTIFTLYFAHIITQFGSYLSFIPVGKALAAHLPVGVAWAILLSVKGIGYLFMPRIYANLAHKHSVAKVVAMGQLLAGCCVGLTALGFVFNIFPLMILGIFFESCASMSLEVLFPSFLNRMSQGLDELKSFMANKVTIEFLAFISARALGGVLNSVFPFWTFLCFDAVSFFAAAFLWNQQIKKTVHEAVANVNVLSWKQYAQYFNKPHLRFQSIKKIFYGILNPAIPVFILGLYKGTDADLGLFYVVAGLGVILGSRLSKYLPNQSSFCLGLTTCEFAILSGMVMVPHLYGFLALVFASIFLGTASDLIVQTLFLDKEGKERSHEASGAFVTAQKIAMLLGYWIYMALAEWFVPLPKPWLIVIGVTWLASAGTFFVSMKTNFKMTKSKL